MEELIQKYNDILSKIEIKEKQTIRADITSLTLSNHHQEIIESGKIGFIDNLRKELEVTLKVSLFEENLEHLLENSPVFLTNRTTRLPSYEIRGIIGSQIELDSNSISLTVYVEHIEEKEPRIDWYPAFTGELDWI